MADPLKSKIGAADPQDSAHNKYIRNLRSTDQLMRQFLKLETGLGNSKEFNRGWIWNFEWCSEDPAKARPDLVRRAQAMMEKGVAFEDAFDTAKDLDAESACEHASEHIYRTAAGYDLCRGCGREFHPCEACGFEHTPPLCHGP